MTLSSDEAKKVIAKARDMARAPRAPWVMRHGRCKSQGFQPQHVCVCLFLMEHEKPSDIFGYIAYFWANPYGDASKKTIYNDKHEQLLSYCDDVQFEISKKDKGFTAINQGEG